MTIQVHGHRGAKARMPENTLPGFAYAIRGGADAIEFDVVVTGDGQLVVSHDPISERGQAPTLDEVLDLAGAFDLEIKTWTGAPHCPAPREFAARVLARIRAHHAENRVAVMCFDFRVLRAMRALAPEIRLAALTETDPRAFSEIAREGSAAEIVAPHFSLVTPEKVAAAHASGIQILPWTVNHPADWDRMIAAQVDGIIADDPEALIAHLVSRGLRASRSQATGEC
ncbi:MAG TPA: glycerophosphodiester phosphodiesterase family protein [Bryobacteraceae bacterium]|nr:glycerophosphodiester phosphodiesterase family protein [Bryobacteraceae bacterium]